MTAFRFRLETVLKLREEERRGQQLRLAAAQQADDVLAGRLADLRQSLVDHRAAHRHLAQVGRIDVDRLLSSERYEMLLRVEQARLVDQRRQLAEEIARRREALAAAHREVRVLEKLRERQAERHRLDEAARERRALDEIGARRSLEEADS
jgi:flagellar FliJ protein